MAVVGLVLSSGCSYAISPPANDQATIAAAKNTCRTAGLQGFKKVNVQQWHQCTDTRLSVSFRLPQTAVAEFLGIGSAIVTVELSDPEGGQHRIDCYAQTGLVMMGPSSSYCYYGHPADP
jgi:hypothetical protein